MSITKRFLAMLLALCMVMSMVPSTVFAVEATDLSTAAQDLLAAMQDGTLEGYTLTENVDLGGATLPAVTLTGAFDGGNFTISNAVVDTADAAGNQGFFSSVEAGASVTNLKLENITVNAVGTNVGILAGYVAGSVTGVSVTGTLNDTRARDGINLGILVGQTAADATVTTANLPQETFTVTHATGTTKSYDVNSYCAAAVLNVSGSVGLVGQANGVAVSGYWKQLAKPQAAVIEQRRADAEEYMRTMGTFKWRTSSAHLRYAPTGGAVTHYYSSSYYTYYGVPYSHYSSSYEQAMYFMDGSDGSGVYKLDSYVEAAGDAYWPVDTEAGKGLGFTGYIGNDCSGAISWAWNSVSPANPKFGGAVIMETGGLVPCTANKDNYGILPVGYTVKDYGRDEAGALVFPSTTTVVAEDIGSVEVLYETYAQAKQGDVIVSFRVDGYNNHARMLAKDPVIVRDASGKIDAGKSFMFVHGQGEQDSDENGGTTWVINEKFTFAELGAACYVPVTMAAFQQEELSAPSVTENEKVATPDQGVIRSEYRILNLKLTVYDNDGNPVMLKNDYGFDSTEADPGIVVYTNAYYNQKLLYQASRGQGRTLNLSEIFPEGIKTVDGQELSGGKYTFTLEATVSGGSVNGEGKNVNTTLTVANNRVFVVNPEGDMIAPVVKVDSYGYEEGTWASGDVMLSVSNSNDDNYGTVSFQYKVGDGQWQPYTKAILHTEDTAGTVYSFKATSQGGQESEVVTFTVKKETTKPSDVVVKSGDAELKTYAANRAVSLFFKDSATFTIEATDDSGIREISYKLVDADGNVEEHTEAAVDNKITITIDEAFVGSIQSVKVVDNAGNENANDSYKSEYFVVEKTAPGAVTVNTNGYESGVKAEESVTFTVSGAEAESGIARYEYSTNGGQTWNAMEATQTTEGTATTPANITEATLVVEGTTYQTYIFRAVSNAENVSENSGETVVFIAGEGDYPQWTNDSELPTVGIYKLATNVNVSANTVLTGELVLDLNGYTITRTVANDEASAAGVGAEGGAFVFVQGGNKLTINDTSENHDGVVMMVPQTSGTVYSGKIAAVYANGTFVLENGTLDNTAMKTGFGMNTGDTYDFTGTVIVRGAFTMNGGKIYGQQNVYTSAGKGAGSAIGLSTGSVTINGGELYGWKDPEEVAAGKTGFDLSYASPEGTVITSNAGTTITIAGGELHGSRARTHGGVIYAQGDVVVTNGLITDGYADNHGGIFVGATGDLEISGGTIKGNFNSDTNAEKYGNNVCKNGTTAIISGGTIGGGVSVYNSGKLVFTGKPVIDGSLNEQGRADIRIYTAGSIHIGSADKAAVTSAVGTYSLATDAEGNATGVISVWTDGTKLPTAGTYKLATDVEISAATTLEGNLVLDLNGFDINYTVADTITASQAVYKTSSFTLTINDSSANKSGTITMAPATSGTAYTATDKYIAAVVIANGKFVLNGGTLDNSAITTAYSTYASGTVMNQQGAFEMNGGVIKGQRNTCATNATSGSAIGVTTLSGNKTVVINGGKIYGWRAEGYEGKSAAELKDMTVAAAAGAVINAGTSSVIEINGGELYGSRVTNHGGVIYTQGDVTINDGLITGGYAGKYAGLIYTSASGCDLTIEGGELTDGYSGERGGLIYATGMITVNDGKLTDGYSVTHGGLVYANANMEISGGEFTGGYSANVGGIDVRGTALTISGGTIKNNTNTNAKRGNNVSLYNDAGVLTITGGTIGGGVSIGGSASAGAGKIVIDNTKDITIRGSLDAKSLGDVLIEGKGTIRIGAADSAAVADKEGKYVLAYGEDGKITGIDSEAWLTTTSLPTSGEIKLGVNVALSQAITLEGDMVLDLNGHTITRTVADDEASAAGVGAEGGAFTFIVNGNKLTIKDTSKNQDGVVKMVPKTAGKIYTGKVSAVYVNNAEDAEGNEVDGEFVLESGILDNTAMKTKFAVNTGDTFDFTGAVTVRGAFTMNGGKIYGQQNTSTTAGKGGGSTIGLSSGSVTINDGELYGWKDPAEVAAGKTGFDLSYASAEGTVITSNAGTTTTIAGGELHGSRARTHGGVIYAQGDVVVTNGLITDGYADNHAGIFVGATGDLEISGGTIKGNFNSDANAEKYGNNVCKNGTTVTISGGTIGGGVSVYNSGKLVLTGNPVIDGSLNEQGRADIRIYTAGSIHIDDAANAAVASAPATYKMVTSEDGTVTGVECFWDNTTALPTAGNVTLENDVNVSDITRLTADMVLDLNGHTVKWTLSDSLASDVYLLHTNGHKLTIKDSSEAKTGTVMMVPTTSGHVFANNISAVYANNQFTLESGTIDNSAIVTSYASYNSGTVCVGGTNTGVFTMNGGVVKGQKNTGTSIGNTGSAIGVRATGTVVINGGEVYGWRKTGEENLAAKDLTETASVAGSVITATGGAKITVNGGKLYGSKTTNRGGAIYINHAGNQAGTTLTIDKTALISGGYSADGGLIYSNGGTITINGGELANGNASGNGGLIYSQIYGTTAGTGNVTVNGGKLTDGKANNGGLIYVSGADVTITNGELTNGYAAQGGGSVYCAHSSNVGGNVTMSGGTISGGYGLNHGGIFCNGATMTISGGTIKNNSNGNAAYGHNVYKSGGTLTISGGNLGGGVSINNGTMNIVTTGETNPVITKIEEEDFYSGDLLTIGTSTINIDGVKATDAVGVYEAVTNEAGKITSLAAVWNDSDSLPTTGTYKLVTDVNVSAGVTMTGNLTLDLNGYTITMKLPDNNASNQAVFKTSSFTLTINDSSEGQDGTVKVMPTTEGTAYSNYVVAVMVGSGKLVLNGGILDCSAITSSYSSYSFGTIFNQQGTVEIYGGAVYGLKNTGSKSGSAIGVADLSGTKTVTINGGDIYGWRAAGEENKAASELTADAAKNGAVIAADISTNAKAVINITGGTIHGAKATTYGGAIYTTGDVTIANATITGGHADRGGLIYAANVTVNSGALTNGYAINHGGLIYATGNVTIAGGDLTGGYAANSGGIDCRGTTVTISGGTIKNNKDASASRGNNVFHYNASGVLTVSGGIIGGGLSISGPTGGKGKIILDTTKDFTIDATLSEQQKGDVLIDTAGSIYLDSDAGTLLANAHGQYYLDKDQNGKVIGATAVWSGSSLPTEGVVKLTKDIKISAGKSLEGNLTLDLNGHTITYTAADSISAHQFIYKTDAYTLTIKDSSAQQKGALIMKPTTAGTVYPASNYIAAVVVDTAAGKLILDGGTIDNSAIVSAYNLNPIGTVMVQQGTFEMNGGVIKGFRSTSASNAMSGSAIGITDVGDGTKYVTINGGKIYGWRADGYEGKSAAELKDMTVAAAAGAVINAGAESEVVIAGGELYGSRVTNHGGVIYTKGNVTVSGEAKLSGGYAGTYGGLIYTGVNTCGLIINGGELTDGYAGDRGGLIYATGDITVSDGKLTDGYAVNHGGLVYAAANMSVSGGEFTGGYSAGVGGIDCRGTELTISGGIIKNNTNTHATRGSNISLYNDAGVLTITGGTIGGGVSIGGSKANGAGKLVIDTTNVVIDGTIDNQNNADVHIEGKGTIHLGTAESAAVADAEAKYYFVRDDAGKITALWGVWNDSTSLPTSGYYKLNTDVTIAATPAQLEKDLTLDLNGHDIIYNVPAGTAANAWIFKISAKTLTITDSSADKSGTVKMVTEDAKFTSGKYIAAVVILNSGKFVLDAGTIDNSAIVSQYSAGNSGTIMIQSGTFEMNGGVVRGQKNTSTSASYTGSAIGVYSAASARTVNINGGKIYGWKNNSNASEAASVVGTVIAAATDTNQASHVNAEINITGGELHGSTATTGGGVIYTFGDLNISGGLITGGHGANHGGIYCKGNMEVSGGTIIGNTNNDANAQYGNNIYKSGGTLTISGGVIGGGVCITGGGKLVLTGNAVIDGTLNAQNRGDVLITGSGTIHIDSASNAAVASTAGKYEVIEDGNGVITGVQTMGDIEQTGATPWIIDTALPTSGEYKLMTDVVITENTDLTGDLILDLNGYTITRIVSAAEVKHAYVFNTNSKNLTINDTSSENDGTVMMVYAGEAYEYTQGLVTAIYINGGAFTLIDGTLDNTAIITAYGSESGGANSGTVTAAGTFTMKGGVIKGQRHVGTFSTRSGSAIGVWANRTVTIEGGEIYAWMDPAEAGSNPPKRTPATVAGGAITAGDKSNVVISGGVIHGGHVSNYGGAIATQGNLTISGGTISGGYADGEGENIYVFAGTVTNTFIVEGGVIDGGVYVAAGPAVTIRNKAMINSNLYGLKMHVDQRADFTGLTGVVSVNSDGVFTTEFASAEAAQAMLTNGRIVSDTGCNLSVEGTAIKGELVKISIGEDKYETVEEALKDAESGDTVNVNANITETTLVVPNGVTVKADKAELNVDMVQVLAGGKLDMGQTILDANNIIVYNGGEMALGQTNVDVENIIVQNGGKLDIGSAQVVADYLTIADSAELSATPKEGKLFVPKESLNVTGTPVDDGKGRQIMPIWDHVENCYEFSLFQILDTDNNNIRGLHVDKDNDVIKFQFKHNATKDLNKALLGQTNEIGENEITIRVKMTWKTADGKTGVWNGTYDQSLVKQVAFNYASDGLQAKDYTLTFNKFFENQGDVTELSIQAYVQSERGNYAVYGLNHTVTF